MYVFILAKLGNIGQTYKGVGARRTGIVNLVQLYYVFSRPGCGCVRLADSRSKSSLESFNYLEKSAWEKLFNVMSQGQPFIHFRLSLSCQDRLEARAGSLAGKEGAAACDFA